MSAHPMTQQEPTWRAGVRPLSNPELGKAGPFFAMTVSAPVTFSQSDWVRAFYEDKEGMKLASRIEPGILYCVKKDEILTDMDVANGAGNGAFVRIVQGTEERVTPVPTSPADNKRFLLQTDDKTGLVFFDAFEGLDERVIRPSLFSSLLRPVTFTPEYQEENPEIAEKIKKQGALALYRLMMEEGFRDIASEGFANRYGAELQRIYLSAKPAVLEMYRMASAYLTNETRMSNARVRTGASKGAHHDTLADYAFYMTGLRPEDEALQRALQPQELTLSPDIMQSFMALRRAQDDVTEPPQVWCENCGTYSNKSPEGKQPKFCSGCREPFAVDVVKAASDTFDPNNPMGEETPTQRKQREARERNSSK